MPRGATCSLTSKAITIVGGSTQRSAISPQSRQTAKPHNLVSTFPGEGQSWGAPMSAFYRYSPGHRRQAHRQRLRKEHAMTTQHLRVASSPADLQVAVYARVSSDQQAERHTIDSQIAELKARALRDGYQVREDMLFIDNGHSGASLI